MTTVYEYRATDERPSIAFRLLDRDGNLHDLSTATFEFRLIHTGTQAVAVTKTTGITGAATSPNVIVAWAAGELANLEAGAAYYGELAWTIAGAQQSLDAADRPLIKIRA